MANQFMEQLQAGLGVAGTIQGIGQQLQKQKFDRDYNKYYKALSEDPEYSPNIREEGYNGKALHAATMAKFTESLQSDEAKASKMRLMDQRIAQQHRMAFEGMQRARVDISQKNYSGALSTMEKTYEDFMDGSDLVIDDDKMGWKIFNPDGSESEHRRFKDEESMVLGMAGVAEAIVGDAKVFADTVWAGDQAITRHNQNRMAEAMEKPWVNKKGEYGFVVEGAVDKFGDGKRQDTMYFHKGRKIDEKEWVKQGFIPQEAALTKAKIEKEKALGVAAKAEKAAAPHNEAKLVAHFMDTYGWNKVQAQEEVNRRDFTKFKMELVLKQVADLDLDLKNPDDRQTFENIMNAADAMTDTEAKRRLETSPVVKKAQERAKEKKKVEKAAKGIVGEVRGKAPKKEKKPKKKGARPTIEQLREEARVLMKDEKISAKEAIKRLNKKYAPK